MSYMEKYQESLLNPDVFWLKEAKSLSWQKTPTKGCEYSWGEHEKTVEHSWFKDGKINVAFNCVDRHALGKNKDKTALIWQGEDFLSAKKYSFYELYQEVNKCSFMLKNLGVKKGDRVCLYMPMIPESVFFMLACAKVGAIHSVVFGGFSAESLAERINDSKCKLLITASNGKRGGKTIPLKSICDEALKRAPSIEHVLVVQHADSNVFMKPGRDIWFHEAKTQAGNFTPETMGAEDPLFILYTSGSTGKPKGVVHTQGGYLLYASLTHKEIFDLTPQDIHWCTADIGWITGHSYVVYGPLANGCTTVIFEGVPTYPDPAAYWRVISKHKITTLYTAPTAIRALMTHGEEWPQKYDLTSLRILGTVGEPINPKAWQWYHDVIGQKHCPVVDTWWQTETGGIMIAPRPHVHKGKPGSASKPFWGVCPLIVDESNKKVLDGQQGALCIKRPWPGIMKTLWNAHDRFIDTYFSKYPGKYFSGDGCKIDDEGDYWLLGRMDDVVNVSGHRIGTAEVESALVSHEQVSEAAVVSIPHAIKGESLYAFVTPLTKAKLSENFALELKAHVRKKIGPVATPDTIQVAPRLPKTRSGKIIRRILRKVAGGETKDFGDTTTLAEGDVILELVQEKQSSL